MKFINYNSAECQVLKDLFNTMPLMDINIANIIEEYIYSTVREYYPNGSIKYEYRTKYGVKDGEYKKWFFGNSVEDCGQLHIQIHYVEGKWNGEYKQWFKNGQLNIETHYIEGKRHGEYKEWWSNGQLRIQAQYVNSKLHGEYKEWFENDQIWTNANYVNGELHGEYKQWNYDGQLIVIEELTYENGEIIDEIFD
jgi:antitoxin component YwqK of YwqJK toxin-antitoxin module